MTEQDTKPTLEERYTVAAQTSNMRVEADRAGDADVIIAAGWSQSRIGGALLRLHTEFDGSPRPRLASRDDFLHDSNRRDRDARKAASRTARAFNLHEMGLHLQKLKSLPEVRVQVTLQLLKWRVEDAETKGVEILQWWLAQSCTECGGTKFQVAEGTGRQTAKLCKTCLGTGKKDLPHDQVGRRAANWMDQCVERARANISGFMGAPSGRHDQLALIRGCCEAILKRSPHDEAARRTLDRLPPSSSAVVKLSGES